MTQDRTNRAYSVLNDRFGKGMRLKSASRVLFWDSQAYMPPDGAWARGEQLAAIEGSIHELVARDDAAQLFASAEGEGDALTQVERANLAEMRTAWREATAAPKQLLLDKQRTVSATLATWRTAKAANDFSTWAKAFEQLLPIYREYAQAKAEAFDLEPYEALMSDWDPGISGANVEQILQDLEAELPKLRLEVIERQKSWPKPLPFEGDFSDERQAILSNQLLQIVVNAPNQSRIDTVPHPFTLTQSPGDARITTRYEPDNIRFAIMIALHESGHALYELGLPRELAFSRAGLPRGATMHESQSLMVENQAGRTPEFLEWLTPRLAETFGAAPCWTFPNVLNTYRRAEEGFIRVEADEMSYPLHMILRYRLEQALLSGDLAVKDVSGAWSDLSQKLFGRRPPTDALGCLQDMHWSAGLFGYFPSYALGATLAAQWFERMTSDDPSVRPSLGRGDFGPYRDWVRPRIHERASLASFDEIVCEVSGAPFGADAFKRHLRHRYLEEPLP